MSICQQCQREIPEINQGRFCPFCGAILGAAATPESTSAAADSPEATTPPKSFSPVSESAAAAPRENVAWEDRERLGFLRAFSQTWSDATFRPTPFFRASPKSGNLGAALLYAFLIGMVASLISSFWQFQFWDAFAPFSGMPEMEGFERFFGAGWNRDMLRFFVISSPLWVLVSVFIRAAILHLMLIIVGGNRHGWDATFRAVAYSAGPQLFAIIPWCGDVISFFWQIVLIVIGAREMHETTTGRVVLAVILPFVLCCGSALLLIYRFAAWFSQFGGQI